VHERPLMWIQNLHSFHIDCRCMELSQLVIESHRKLPSASTVIPEPSWNRLVSSRAMTKSSLLYGRAHPLETEMVSIPCVPIDPYSTAQPSPVECIQWTPLANRLVW
jgi:hypothetical protein